MSRPSMDESCSAPAFAASWRQRKRRGSGVTNTIEAVGLSKRYGRRWALQDCTVNVPSGRVVGLVGANAAGRSTLMRLLVGLLAPGLPAVLRPAAAPAHRPHRPTRTPLLDVPRLGDGDLRGAGHRPGRVQPLVDPSAHHVSQTRAIRLGGLHNLTGGIAGACRCGQ